MVRFIGTDLDHPLSCKETWAAVSPQDAARMFLSQYGGLFGLRDQAEELRLMRTRSVDRGRAFVRFQQIHRGVPVLGGELIVQMDRASRVVSAGGEILPEPQVDPLSSIPADSARQLALLMVAKHYNIPADELVTSEPELWVYAPVLLGAPGPQLTRLVWRVEVSEKELASLRELVLVDAHLGGIVVQVVIED